MTGDDVSHQVDCSRMGESDRAAVADDLQLAAGVDVPVLISGPPSRSREIACELDRRSGAPDGKVEVVDCRVRGALKALRRRPAAGQRERCNESRPRILLLEEVHALSPDDQALLVRRLEEVQRVQPHDTWRIVASSSVPLFDRVEHQLFSELLFYRLNVIHIVVPAGPEP